MSERVLFFNKKLKSSGNKENLVAAFEAVHNTLKVLDVPTLLLPQHLFQRLRIINRLGSSQIPMPYSPGKILHKHRAIFFHTVNCSEKHLSLKPGYFPKMFYLNKGGYSGWAIPRDPSPSYKNFVNQHLQEIRESNKYDTNGDTGSTAKLEKYLLILAQTESDSVGNLHYFSNQDFISFCKALAEKLKCVPVLKPHPKSNQYKNDAVMTLDKNQALFPLIDGAEYVITQNSGAGLQAVLRNKKVLTTAHSDFKDLTVNIEPQISLEEAIKLLGDFKPPTDQEISDNLAAYMFHVDYQDELTLFIKHWLSS